MSARSSVLHPSPRATALVVFLTVTVLAGAVVWQSERVRGQVERDHVAGLAGAQGWALQHHLEHALVGAYALAALVRQGQGAIPDFAAVAGALLPQFTGVDALCLAPAGVLRAIVPLAGNEQFIGRDLLAEPALREEAEFTRASGRLTLAGPFELEPGRLALAGRLPVFLPDAQGRPAFWGFTIARIPWPAALAPTGLDRLTWQGLDYALWRTHPDTGARDLIDASAPTPLAAPVVKVLEVANATWVLAVAPTAGWGHPVRLLFKTLLALLVSVLSAVVARLLIETRAQARRLAVLVEERTAQSEERFRRLLDEVPAVAVQGYGLDGITRYWNRASEQLYGYSAQAAIGRPLLDLIIPPEQHDAVRGAMAQMAATGQPIAPAELSLQRRDGSRVVVFSSHALVQIPGRAPEFFCIDIDRTEPRRAREALAVAVTKYQTLFDAFPLGITVTDAAGEIVEVNAASERLLGVSRAEHGARRIDAPQWGILRPDGQPMPAAEFPSVRALKEQRLVAGVELGIVKGPEVTWLTVTAAPLPLPGYGVVVAYGDITAQKQAELALHESEERYRQIVETANEGIWLIDREGVTTFANRQMELILGCPPGGLIGHPFYDFMDAEGRREAEQNLAQRNQGIAAQHEFRFIRTDGTEVWTLVVTTPLLGPDGQVAQALAMITDITERKEREDEVRRLALFDPLTGLPNRRLLLDRLGQAMAAGDRTGQRGALMFVDLDDFKAVNDGLGHDAGDRLLQQVAGRLSACLRRCDSVARFGGDEFVVLLGALHADPVQAAAQAGAIGEKLLAAFIPPFDLKGQSHRGSCSIGITLFTGSGERPEELLRRADHAMYQAKAAGRNTLRLWDPQGREVLPDWPPVTP